MIDSGIAYIVMASLALAGGVALIVFLSRSHETLKRTSPLKARIGYAHAVKVSLLVLLLGGILVAAGFLSGLVLVSWFGSALLSAGVWVFAYNSLGYLDVPRGVVHSRRTGSPQRPRQGAIERLATLAVILGFIAFTSLGFDFVAFPAAVLALVVIGILIVLRLRTRRSHA